MTNKTTLITHKKGAQSELPVLAEAELALTTDQKRVFMGTNSGNIELAKQTIVDNKVDKVEGKGLSTNDFTNDYKTKVDNYTPYTLTAATKSKLGGVIVGDGLSVSGGTISAQYRVDNNITLDMQPNDFSTGATFTTVLLNASNALHQSCNALVNSMLSYTLANTSITYRYRITTYKRDNTMSRQFMELYNNTSDLYGQHVFTLTRESSASTGEWSKWKINPQIIGLQGNPNGVTGGMRGMLCYDLENSKLYKKTTGTSTTTNTGWEEV